MSPGFAPSLRRARSDLGPTITVFQHRVDAALAAKLPDDLRLAARQDLRDAPLAAARRLADSNGDAIAVPERDHFARGEIHVGAAVVGPQKAEAVAVRLHVARDEIESDA